MNPGPDDPSPSSRTPPLRGLVAKEVAGSPHPERSSLQPSPGARPGAHRSSVARPTDWPPIVPAASLPRSLICLRAPLLTGKPQLPVVIAVLRQPPPPPPVPLQCLPSSLCASPFLPCYPAGPTDSFYSQPGHAVPLPKALQCLPLLRRIKPRPLGLWCPGDLTPSVIHLLSLCSSPCSSSAARFSQLRDHASGPLHLLFPLPEIWPGIGTSSSTLRSVLFLERLSTAMKKKAVTLHPLTLHPCFLSLITPWYVLLLLSICFPLLDVPPTPPHAHEREASSDLSQASLAQPGNRGRAVAGTVAFLPMIPPVTPQNLG